METDDDSPTTFLVLFVRHRNQTLRYSEHTDPRKQTTATKQTGRRLKTLLLTTVDMNSDDCNLKIQFHQISGND